MARIILSIIFIIVIVLFVSFNVRNTTSLSLFGKPIEDVSVVSVALISFVVGILYSFVFYAASYFSKQRRGRIKAQEQLTRIKGKEIKEREKKLEKAGERKGGGAPATPAPQGESSGGISSMFSRKRRKKSPSTSSGNAEATKAGKS
jgi:uncharacterized integral membrane protein